MVNSANKCFYFGSNFKMHKTASEVKTFVQALNDAYKDRSDLRIFIIPPFTALGGLQDTPRLQNLWVGAQNIHWESSGAFTGEISAAMVRDLGVDLVMLGHAERRQKFGEKDRQIRKKLRSAFDHDLRVLLCVGETAKQREADITNEVLSIQLKVALSGCSDEDTAKLMVAYEPVWAIGAGSKAAHPVEVAAGIKHIRHTLNLRFGEEAQRIPVLYGGSVNETNCKAYAQETDVDGLFVGRSAWQPEGFINVLRTATATRFP